MNYDTSLWKMVDVNYIQASGFEMCQMGEIGPSGNFPSPEAIVQLGNVEYQFSTFEN